MTQYLNATNYERKVQSFSTKVADLIAEIKKGKLSHYHLTTKAAALEKIAIELEQLCILKDDNSTVSTLDLDDFKAINLEAQIHVNNTPVLRYWKKKLNLISNDELFEYWKKVGGGKNDGEEN